MTCLRSRPISIQSEPGLIVSATDFSGSSCSRIWSKYATCTFVPSRTVPASGASCAEDQLDAASTCPRRSAPIRPRRSPRCMRSDRSRTIVPLAEALARRRQLGDELAGALAGIERELDVAEPLAPRGALVAQRFEPAHAAFVARAARLDAVADPHFLLRPELVELAIRDLLGGELLALARFVGGEVAGDSERSRPRSSSTMRVATRSRKARSCVMTIDVGPFSSSSSSAVMPSMSR